MENRRGALSGYGRWEGEEEGDEEDEVAPGASPSSQMSELEDVQVEMLEKARELFQLCDKDEKGFITKVDMQRLQNELPLTPEQLETVFDSLEQNNNGYLTPVEFSMGLGKNCSKTEVGKNHSRHEETFESGWSDDLDQADDEEKRFCSMMEQLGAAQVPREVRELWARLRKERPELLSSFEEFLLRVSSYIKEAHHERESMEQALKRRETDHDREVRCLYEEMEQQIKAERERLIGQVPHLSWLKSPQTFSGLKDSCWFTWTSNSSYHAVGCMNSHIYLFLQETLRHDRSNLLQKELHSKEQDFRMLVFTSLSMNASLSLSCVFLWSREMNKKLRDERDTFEAKKLVSLRKKILIPRHPPFICCYCCHHSGACHFHGGQ
uniref:Calcium release activated channel regulator 2B n=1 Tax=Nothoprocta perdicaria TaxID=30464 RepID=A0A8C6YSJ4_NOTPE